MPPTVTMPLVSFTDEAHMDPNNILEINRMEEYPSADVAPMAAQEEDNPEHMGGNWDGRRGAKDWKQIDMIKQQTTWSMN